MTNIIAEAEINHNGDVGIAKKLVSLAKEADADYVKFQCFGVRDFISPDSDFYKIFQPVELSLAQFKEIKAFADSLEIPMISTAADLTGLEMICQLGLPVVKVGSTNITNVSLLKAIADSGKEVILSTGASYLGEIEQALDCLSNAGKVSLMHCTVQYPASFDQLNLNALTTLKHAFPGIAVGFSDHSVGYEAAMMAIALGADFLEKHYTLDHNLPGPDHGFSADEGEFKLYVNKAREAQAMLGSARKMPIQEEMGLRVTARRFITADKELQAGDVITEEMIRPRRVKLTQDQAVHFYPADQYYVLLGKVIKQPVNKYQPIGFDDVS